ncbi:MAG: transposase [Ardenticatenaceae bacterium]|nr:transposase [Ardenticatenaceae bacterium]
MFDDSDDVGEFDIFEDTERVELYVHLIWSTAGQQPWLDEEWDFELGIFMNDVMVNNDGALLCSAGGNDHLHLLVALPPTLSLDEAVKVLKMSSARWVGKHIPGRETFAWQEEYFAESISPWSVEEVRAFIHNQREYHQEHTFQEEIRAFLEENALHSDDEDDLWA